uniref:Uncharacterized protein n=1 Tax=Mucochytrium quahogii TaxID=96639 RepID=A0A7S2WDE8_9STRA
MWRRDAIGELRIPQLEGSRGSLSPLAETNGLTSLNKGQTLAAAAGDGNAYCWDVATQVLTHCFSGHKDYLHSIVSLERNGLIATGSEDGTCKFWDVREKKENQCVATLESGDIVSALSVSNDGNWLVMGGSSNGMGNFNMCHVASRVITDGRKCKHNTRVQSMTFTDKALVLGGDGQNLEYWSMNGSEYIVDVPTSSSSVFGLHYDSSAGILVSGGSSAFIDVFSEERSHMVSLQA